MLLPSARSASRRLILLTSSWLVACGNGDAAGGAASTRPSASAATHAVASVNVPGMPFTIPPGGPPVVHQAGTVPLAVASALAKQDAEAPLPASAPKMEPSPARPGKRTTPAFTATRWVDDAHLAIVSPGSLEIVDPMKGTSTTLRTGARITAFTKRATTFVTADESNRIVMWDLTEKSPPRAWPALPKDAKWDPKGVLALSRDGSRIAHASSRLVVWDAADGKEISSMPREFSASGLSVTPTEVGMIGNGQMVESWTLPSAKKSGEATFATGGTFGVALSSDLKWAAGAAIDGHGMQVSAVRGSGEVRQLVDGTDCAHHISVSFSPDSRYVYAHYGQARVKGFETGTWRPYASYSATEGRMIASLAGDLGRVVTTASDGDPAPAVVAVSTQKSTPLERPFASPTSTYAINDEGSLILASDETLEVRVWSAKTGRVVYEITAD